MAERTIKSTRWTASVRFTKDDEATFSGKVRKGELSADNAKLLTGVYAFARATQSEMGPGYEVLDTIYQAMPKAYQKNWLKTVLQRAA